MRRQGGYGGSNVNPLVAAQMQHIAAQRMQHNPGLNPFPARSDVPPLEEEQRYMSAKAEGHWQWEGGDPKGPNMPPHIYKEGPGPPDPGSGNMLPTGPESGSPFYPGQMPDSKGQPEKTNVKDVKGSEHEQQIDAGYQESLPQTLELLEQKFLDEIMKLSKEQNDAEDEENIRHQERTREINYQYQEKLRAMRAQQAKYREEFLRREAQIRQQQYQQATLSQLQHNPGGPMGAFNENMHDHHGHGAGLVEGHPGYPGGYDSYNRDRAAFYGGGGHPFNRNQGYDARGPYPGGRVYDSAPRYY